MNAKGALTSNQLIPGMTISVEGNIFRVESATKVTTVAKTPPFIKTKLKNLITEEIIEKNFKEGQTLQEVALDEHTLEYLYIEGKDYLFLDIDELERVIVPKGVIGDKVNYIKEGIQVKAKFYGDRIFSIELPQFLELMVVKTEGEENANLMTNATKFAILETGARIKVPMYIESGDIIKIDTLSNEWIQRV